MVGWKRYQKKMAKKLRKKLPSSYYRGPNAFNGHVEIKAWSRPMGRAAVKEEIRKGGTIIQCKSGFTSPAIKYVMRYHPRKKLYHGPKRIW